VLDWCHSVFADEQDFDGLGQVFSARADLASELGNQAQALAFEEAALRYRYMDADYMDADPSECATCHHRISYYFPNESAYGGLALAHRLAGAVLLLQTEDGRLAACADAIASGIRNNPAWGAALPATFDELCNRVEQIEGVHFRHLFERLPRRTATGDEALQVVLALVDQHATVQ
jgi:hypothetical protein